MRFGRPSEPQSTEVSSLQITVAHNYYPNFKLTESVNFVM